MAAPMVVPPPPPFKVPYLTNSGAMSEEWRRFLLTTQTTVAALVAFTARLGSGTGMVGMEDPASSDDFSIIPGPVGPPGPPGTPGLVPGSSPVVLGGLEDAATDDWALIPGPAGATGATGATGASGSGGGGTPGQDGQDGDDSEGLMGLPTTGVATGTYGSSTQVAQVTVGPDGRLVVAANVTIAGGGGPGGATDDFAFFMG